MKFNFGSIWKYVAGGGTVLGYQAFYDRMANNSNELKETIKSIDKKIDFIHENMDKSKMDNKEISEMNKILKEYKDSINELSNIQNKYCKKHGEITENINEGPKNLFDSYKEEFTKAFNKAKEINDKVDKKYDNIGKLYSEDNNEKMSFMDISEFKDYLDSLSTTEICLVINISSCLFILACLSTIIFAVYGNFFIDKFSLEEKYPKLAVFIKLRVKLQHIYIINNTSLIVVGLILMVIINYLTLTNGG